MYVSRHLTSRNDTASAQDQTFRAELKSKPRPSFNFRSRLSPTTWFSAVRRHLRYVLAHVSAPCRLPRSTHHSLRAFPSFHNTITLRFSKARASLTRWTTCHVWSRGQGDLPRTVHSKWRSKSANLCTRIQYTRRNRCKKNKEIRIFYCLIQVTTIEYLKSCRLFFMLFHWEIKNPTLISLI
jgi:hypothetical protein